MLISVSANESDTTLARRRMSDSRNPFDCGPSIIFIDRQRRNIRNQPGELRFFMASGSSV